MLARRQNARPDRRAKVDLMLTITCRKACAGAFDSVAGQKLLGVPERSFARLTREHARDFRDAQVA